MMNQHYLDWKINQLEKEKMQTVSKELVRPRELTDIQAELRSYRAMQNGDQSNTEFKHTFITRNQAAMLQTNNSQ